LGKKEFDFLTIVSGDDGGGAQQTQFNIVSELISQQKRCYVIIITKKTDGRWESLEDKCKITYFPFKSHFLGFLLLGPFLLYLFSVKRFQYIFSSQTLINSMIGSVKRVGVLRNTKVIARESNSIFQLISGYKLKRYAIAYKVGYPGVDLIICQTSHMKNNLLKALPWITKKTKVCVLSNPVNFKDIEIKSKEIIPGLDKEKYIVAAGRLVDAKGFDILINVYAKIREDLNGCKLFILGEGEKRKELERQINDLGLNKDVVLKGMVSNVYPYFKNARLCVMSSRIEGFPNVLLQMMSQNENVVTTLSAGDIDSIPNIVTCPSNDEAKLAKAILECYNSGTINNRSVYDRFLKERNLNHFVNKIIDIADGTN
tara:strand:+ start:73 stop:1185 length:1113 start_codon:yes stop_codon:yes gene_type:complete